jgi:hypothetical protein
MDFLFILIMQIGLEDISEVILKHTLQMKEVDSYSMERCEMTYLLSNTYAT